MKIVCVDKGDIFIMPDTVVFNVDEPFYAPDFGPQVESISGMAIKINRMVKCIEAKFAHRAWEVASHCIDYRIVGHNSVTIGRSFDRSFCVTSDWQSKIELDATTIEKFDKAIETVSNFVTLRVGDYIFVNND